MAYRIFVSLLVTFFGLISISHANWYGKRGKDDFDNLRSSYFFFKYAVVVFY